MCAGAERMSMYVWLTNTKLGMSRLGSRGPYLHFFFFRKENYGLYFWISKLKFQSFSLKNIKNKKTFY
jgi:hypothetical protein